MSNSPPKRRALQWAVTIVGLLGVGHFGASLVAWLGLVIGTWPPDTRLLGAVPAILLFGLFVASVVAAKKRQRLAAHLACIAFVAAVTWFAYDVGYDRSTGRGADPDLRGRQGRIRLLLANVVVVCRTGAGNWKPMMRDDGEVDSPTTRST